METYDLFRRVTAKPGGHAVFSLLYGLKAPYFSTLAMRVRHMRPHFASLVIPKRRRVENHIGTVHAIAICNGLEAAMGLLAEATCPPSKRWIPRGMNVDYTAKSTSDILCTAETEPTDWNRPDVPVRVRALRDDGTVVVTGTITIYVSDRPPLNPAR